MGILYGTTVTFPNIGNRAFIAISSGFRDTFGCWGAFAEMVAKLDFSTSECDLGTPHLEVDRELHRQLRLVNWQRLRRVQSPIGQLCYGEHLRRRAAV